MVFHDCLVMNSTWGRFSRLKESQSAPWGGVPPKFAALESASSETLATAGLAIVCSCIKKQFAKKLRGLRKIQDHRWKALKKTHIMVV